MVIFLIPIIQQGKGKTNNAKVVLQIVIICSDQNHLEVIYMK